MFSARSLPSLRTHAIRPIPDESPAIGAQLSFTVRNSAIVTIVSAFVFLTSAVFAMSLQPLAAALIVLGCIAGTWLIATRPAGGAEDLLEAPVIWRRLALCIGVATLLMLLGGETHVFYANRDWHIRDAVLADLVRHGMATVYHIGDMDYILRAPLGMYALPSLVGRLSGLSAAHVALLLQNGLFLGAIFYLLSSLGRGWRHLAIIVFFAGLVLVPSFMHRAAKHGVIESTTVLDAWLPFWQYSSSMVQFFWVPNHALPGWWLATLLLLSRRARIDEATIGVTIAGLAVWSPLAILPAIPWLLYRGAVAWRAVFLSVRTWSGVAVAACFAPLLIYLVQGFGTIAHGSATDVPDLSLWYPFFIVVQLPAVAFCVAFWRHVPPGFRALFIVNSLVLLFLPSFSFGPANDLVCRGSIAALTIVGFVFGEVVLDLSDKRATGATAGLALILAMLPSATSEILRAIILPRTPISACTLMEATNTFEDKQLPTNYVVARDTVPRWLFDTSAAPIAAGPGDACSPKPASNTAP